MYDNLSAAESDSSAVMRLIALLRDNEQILIFADYVILARMTLHNRRNYQIFQRFFGSWINLLATRFVISSIFPRATIIKIISFHL